MRVLTLEQHDGYLSLWADDRSGIVSGDLLIEGVKGAVGMGAELGDFLSASRSTEKGLRVVFGGAEATSFFHQESTVVADFEFFHRYSSGI